jgi:hypothetical protein
LEHVCDIVEPTDLGLKLLCFLSLQFKLLRVPIRGGLLVNTFLAQTDLFSSLLQGDDMPPGDKEANELLTEDPQRLVPLIFGVLFIIILV